MPYLFDFPEESRGEPIAPLIWISHNGFQHATGVDLRTPVHAELLERLGQGLAMLDNDFPDWLEGVAAETDDGLVLRFRDLEAVRNVASTLQHHGVMQREWERAA
jgi:hypothetical protein